jgi:hypothetical protein
VEGSRLAQDVEWLWMITGVDETFGREDKLHFPQGLRMGMLWDLVAKQVRRSSVSLQIEWNMFGSDLE